MDQFKLTHPWLYWATQTETFGGQIFNFNTATAIVEQAAQPQDVKSVDNDKETSSITLNTPKSTEQSVASK